MDLINDKLSKVYLKYLAAAFGSAFMGSVFGLVDMVMVGQALSNKLKGIHSAHYLADALSGLRAEFSDLEATASREDRVLRALIGSRARGFDLKVRKLPKGWSVISNELRGSGTQNPDVRVAIAHALDQAITAHIMMK